MDHSTHNQIVSFIWGIADDVLRDVYVRDLLMSPAIADAVTGKIDVTTTS